MAKGKKRGSRPKRRKKPEPVKATPREEDDIFDDGDWPEGRPRQFEPPLRGSG